MKKISTFIIVAAMTFAFAACGGEKKTSGETTQEGTEAVEEAKAEAGLVDQYVVILEKVAELTAKIKDGDETVRAEYDKAIDDFMKFAKDNEKELEIEFAKPENIQKMMEANKKLGMDE